MKMIHFCVSWFLLGGLSLRAGIPLTESTFTEIIQEANVVAATSKAVTPARPQELFKAPDLVRTGQASRVELTAKDQTITRIGANTTFTFATGGRDIHLKSGSVLFHSPAGAGGGSIKNRGSSAAVLGTTEIGTVFPDGRFKVLDLEGSVRVSLRNGAVVMLKPGQFVIISADGDEFEEVHDFNLGELVARLQLVVGFSQTLSSMPLIEAAIQEQNRQIAAGNITHLASIQLAGFGLDIRYRALNDLPFYSFNPVGESNPLDFPGTGPIGPHPDGPGGYATFPPGIPPGGFVPIISPPLITDPNP